MDDSDLNSVIVATLTQAPDWVRAEFACKDPALKQRAAETLAAILSAALMKARHLTFDPPTRTNPEGGCTASLHGQRSSNELPL